MTVVELLDSILKAYPGANPDALATFRPVFVARFGKREGPHLRAAFEATLAEFKPKYGTPFPIPADFERHMPSATLHAGNDKGGPPLDLAGRKGRADSLFASWQAGQCRRADKGNLLLRRALENTARQVADVMGWQENPEPLVLTSAQLKKACQSAISQERRARYGQPPKDKHLWWRQLSSVAAEWGIQITPEWWDKPTGEAFKAGADDEPKAPPRVTPTTVARDSPAIPRDPAVHLALLKDRIRFFADMGMVDYVAQMKRELAELEPQEKAA